MPYSKTPAIENEMENLAGSTTIDGGLELSNAISDLIKKHKCNLIVTLQALTISANSAIIVAHQSKEHRKTLIEFFHWSFDDTTEYTGEISSGF